MLHSVVAASRNIGAAAVPFRRVLSANALNKQSRGIAVGVRVRGFQVPDQLRCRGWMAGVPGARQMAAQAMAVEEDTEESSVGQVADKIRNFSVIAHVDHGKTTLVDKLLSASNEVVTTERVMDGMALEKERGITISSKNTSFLWNGHTFNAVDTPGHADFGGEVERVLDMVDGALLLVDAYEGVLAQTKFVVSKALARGLKPILVLNKVDRDAATEERCGEVEGELFDLFASYGADDDTLDFTTIFASAKNGWAANSYEEAAEIIKNGHQGGSMEPLLQAIHRCVPPPKVDNVAPFQMLVSMVERDNFIGRMVTGRIHAGSVKVGDRMSVMTIDSNKKDAVKGALESKVTRIFRRRGLQRTEMTSANAGDIVTLAGVGEATVTDSVQAPGVETALPTIAIDPPTLSMTFRPNDSPLGGKEGTKLTGGKIGDRLYSEAETNVALRVVQPGGGGGEEFEVQGRGELHLGVLIETMRREGFELGVSPPAVLYKTDENGKQLEPMEECVIEVEEKDCGIVIENMSWRQGEMSNMETGVGGGGRTRLTFSAPSRGLIGFQAKLQTLTSGTGVCTRQFKGYHPKKGKLDKVRQGVLISMDKGDATSYALNILEPRGIMFTSPGEPVYGGMVIGEHSRGNDIEVNPCKQKKLTNHRATAGADEAIRLAPPRKMTLEEAIGYVAPDELIEITPGAIRLRKRFLDAGARKRNERSKNAL